MSSLNWVVIVFFFFSNANLAWFQPLTSWTMFTNSKTCRTMCEEKEGFCKQRHPVIKGELAQIKWRSQISAKFGQGQVVSPETMWKLLCWKKKLHTHKLLVIVIDCCLWRKSHLSAILRITSSGQWLNFWGWLKKSACFFSNLKYPPAPPFTTTCTKTGKSHKSHRGGHLSNFHPG